MNGESALLLYWQELGETLDEAHCILLVEDDQEETEEKTLGEVHLEEEIVSVEEAGTKELVEQAKSLRLLVVMGLESSVIFHCYVSFGSFVGKSFFLLF